VRKQDDESFEEVVISAQPGRLMSVVDVEVQQNPVSSGILCSENPSSKFLRPDSSAQPTVFMPAPQTLRISLN